MNRTLRAAVIRREATWLRYYACLDPEKAERLAREKVKARYKSDVCQLCKGPADVCAVRHVKGRSCA